MKLECIVGTDTLSIGKKYEILEINSSTGYESTTVWYWVIGDNGKRRYPASYFVSIEAEIRDRKLTKLLEDE
jgi:hypothetical protein